MTRTWESRKRQEDVAPMPGLVIGYRFLWSHEARAGETEGFKMRPCVIAGVGREGKRTVVDILPITHAPPSDPSIAVEIPPHIKRRMKLDSEPSWVICNEVNVFGWRGPDVGRMRLDDGSRKIQVGSLYGGLFRELQEKVEELERRQAINIIHRVP